MADTEAKRFVGKLRCDAALAPTREASAMHERAADHIERLEAENAALRAQVETLTRERDEAKTDAMEADGARLHALHLLAEQRGIIAQTDERKAETENSISQQMNITADDCTIRTNRGNISARYS